MSTGNRFGQMGTVPTEMDYGKRSLQRRAVPHNIHHIGIGENTEISLSGMNERLYLVYQQFSRYFRIRALIYPLTTGNPINLKFCPKQPPFGWLYIRT